jgi:hypothetical protein
MKRHVLQVCISTSLLFLILLLAGCSPIQTTPAVTPLASAQTASPTLPPGVVWEDPVFEAEVRQTLMKQEGTPVTAAELKSVTTLSLTMGVTSLADLMYFENLEELLIDPDYQLKQDIDLTPIGELKKLTVLTLRLSGDETDFNFLKELPQLTSLTIQWPCDNADISFLSTLSNLTELGLIEMTGIDLANLSGLTKLTILSLKYCDVTDISALENLINLKSLMLQDSAQLEDLSPVAGMKELTFLDLTACVGIKSLEPLRGLEKLTELTIVDNSGLDLSPVAHVKYINGQEREINAP